MGGRGVVGVGLLERGGELARIEEAVAALGRERGGVLVIEGAAGVGKSSLLQVLCEQAGRVGVQTLTARASELERSLGFGVVRQLLERRVARASACERAELLAGAAGLAAPVLGVGGEKMEGSFAALHGLYWLVANVAAGGPVVLACDDLHWGDEPSLRWLVYMCNRLAGLPVLVAATTRPPRPGHSRLLAELLAIDGTQVLQPAPLSGAAVAQLLDERLGAQPDPTFVSACMEITGGNPFVVHALIFDLTADGIAPVGAEVAGVAERVPAQLERVTSARLGRLDQAAVRLAWAVAVLGQGSGLRLAATLAGLDIDVAAEAADALWSADLLDEGRPLRFVHPLVRSAIYEQLAPGARSQAHARAARLLAAEGVGSDQVAAQLLVCEPAGDADAVQSLRAAAAMALARGAPEAAVAYLRRALAEPPLERTRATVLGELGHAERIARDPAAVVHLEQAWQATTDPVARARLTGQLADVLHVAGNLARASTVLQAGLADLGDRDLDLATRLHTHNVVLGLYRLPRSETAVFTLEWLRELAEQGVPASRFAQLTLANVSVLRGACSEVAELVERGWDHGRFLAEEPSEMVLLFAVLAVYTLMHVDRLERAHELAEAILVDARTRGSTLGFVAAVVLRGMVALRRGALADAEADARIALELATEHDLTVAIPAITSTLGATLLERGELEQASALVGRMTLNPALMHMTDWLVFCVVGARVRLACGQRTRGIADLRRCGQLADRALIHNPSFFAWRSTLALALASEHVQEARELAQAELELARHAGTPRAIGVALRVCGLLADRRDGLELLEQSVAVLEPSPARLELAHSLTELGAALRRAGARTAAREPLRRALDLAHRCGATPLAERAREEALTAGARPRRPWVNGVQALTPSEFRVARLAAQPWSNRDIAQALFITTKTVSDHLSSAYRKLNIHSRAELAEAMARHATLYPSGD